MIDVLTSLRAFFAFFVFMSHWGMIDNDSFGGHVFYEGYVGVSFFFVLSGFIIAYNYEEKLSTGFSKYNFYIARFARIYPLHVLTCILAAVLFVFPIAFENFTFVGLINTFGKLCLNLFLLHAYVPDSAVYFSYNSTSWSLCCEQLFYALCPIIFTRFKNNGVLLIATISLIVLMAIGMSITPESRYNDFWYVNPLLRFPEFLVGVLCFHVYKIWRPELPPSVFSILELLSVGLFCAFYIFAENVPLTYRCSLYYMFPIACLILIFSWQGGVISKFLSYRIFIWLGKISYGFYLFHFLIIKLLISITRFYDLQCEPLTEVVVVFIVTLIISGLSYHWFELPLNKWIKKRMIRPIKES